MNRKVTFGIVVSTRGFFPASLAAEGRGQIIKKLRDLGYDYVISPQDATPNGAIETYQHAKICAELFRSNSDRIDGIIVSLPNFGDEQGVVQSIDMAGLNVPVLVQACDDHSTKMDLAHRRDGGDVHDERRLHPDRRGSVGHGRERGDTNRERLDRRDEQPRDGRHERDPRRERAALRAGRGHERRNGARGRPGRRRRTDRRRR